MNRGLEDMFVWELDWASGRTATGEPARAGRVTTEWGPVMTGDPTDERLAGLVTRLLELTRSRQVRWELAEADRDDSFTYATPAGAVTVFSRDNDGRDPYVLTIRDADGRLVERADLRWNSVDGHLYELIDRLYRAARRQVLRTDAVIEALLRDLG